MSSVGPVAEASVLIRPDLAGFAAALETELAAISKAAIVPIKVVPVAAPGAVAAAAASEGLATAQVAVTAAAEESAAALVGSGAAAEADAVAQTTDAEAAAANAAAHAKLAQGVAASSLSLLKIRGATLAASVPFLAGAAAVTILAKSVREAVDEQEAEARVVRVLGTELGEGSRKWARQLADSFGLSATVGLQFEGQLANILAEAGFVSGENARLSQTLVQLAADLGAFAHVPVTTALRAISLGLVGNSRGLRQFGIELNTAAVNEEAFRETGKTHAADLTRMEKIQARINLLLAETGNAQGAAADRAGGLSQKERILESNLANLAATLGSAVIPELLVLTDDLTEVVKLAQLLASLPGKIPFFDAVEGFISKHHDLGQVIGTAIAFPPLTPFIAGFKLFEHFTKSNDDLVRGSALTKQAFERMAGPIGFLIPEIARLDSAFNQAAADFRKGIRLEISVDTNQLRTAEENLLNLQNAGASLEAQLNAAGRAVSVSRKRVAAEQQNPVIGTPTQKQKILAQRRQAEQDLATDISAQKGIADDIAAKAKAADDAKKQHAQELAAEKAKADQAFLDAITGRRAEAFDVRRVIVEGTKSLQDDIRLEEDYQRFLTRQIAQIRASTVNEKDKTAEIHNLTVERARSAQAEKADRDQAAQNRVQANRDKRERLQTIADLNIQIAQTNANTKAEIAARKAKIKLDQEQLKSVQGDTVRTKQLQLDIATNRAALKKLTDEVDKRRQDLFDLEVAFLQTQSGFAANLLSNILPTSAVAGTVGGNAISTPTPIATAATAAAAGSGAVTPTGPTGGGGGGLIGFGPRQPDLVGVGAQGGAPPGPTSGQMSILIQINRQILSVLMRQINGSQHPEAVVQRAQQGVNMDIF